MKKACVIDIQRYCIHDGDGIRTTVFFKGCPLRCVWCHNPESMNFEPQLLYSREKCGLCLLCKKACPISCIETGPNGVLTQPGCTGCGGCVDVCPNGAREIAGKSCSAQDILNELDKDAMFYEQSGGGVTLSGGEALAQDADFLEELLKGCKKRGFHVSIDTSGQAPWSKFERVIPYTDVFLYDIKLMDGERHKKYTGSGNELILSNLTKLSETGAKIYIRLPLIEGINCSDEDMNEILRFLKGINVQRVYLLPYHKIGSHKREKLGLEEAATDMAPPDRERLERIKGNFEQNGFDARIGG
ncbi:MAG: 4-hydroxyphenylacetate decarboxylase activating enzyme [Firmicutes bacterium ADurb.Bin182]|nr:MAG: 4-hydroxyphenylacetate decarboxylase activating enzyme [Firmicutes bacterium ADurb.Bin182]